MGGDTLNKVLFPKNVEVVMDGLPVHLPSERRSLPAIRSYLETLALEQQRILCSFSVDGTRANLSQSLADKKKFRLVEAESICLDEMPLQLLETALQQTDHAREETESAITQVLINNGVIARESWWNLAKELKSPLLTLSLLPADIYGSPGERASMTQLRKWQLQQLASIIKDVDEACGTEDPSFLSNALENKVLPWLEKLRDLIRLWLETAMAASRRAVGRAA